MVYNSDMKNILHITKKIDKFVVHYSPFFRWLTYLMTSILIIDAIICVTEYVNVAVFKNTFGYPWGWQGAPNYASPQAYSQSMVVGAIWALIFIMLVLETERRKRSLYGIFLIILYVLMNWFYISLWT